MEEFTQPEKTREELVIEALDAKGFEDPEAKELFDDFVLGCMGDADIEANLDPENPEASNRANIKAQIKIGALLAKTQNHREYAYESLNDALMAASQNDSTQDLADEIGRLIDSL